MSKQCRLKAVSWILVTVCALSACSVRVPEAERSPVVAEVGGERITLRELDGAISADLYRLRAESLHQMVALRMERIDAAKRGISVKKYRAEQVDARVPNPTDVQLSAALVQAKHAGTVPPETQLESVRNDLSNFLTRGQRREVKEKYIDQLYLDYGVRMNLDALGRPKIPLRVDGPSLGPADAPVVIVEYTDYNSEFGAMANKTMQEVLKTYPREVRLVCKHKPDTQDETGVRAAEAALCASAQNRYWDYRQALFSQAGNLAPEVLKRLAAELRLNTEEFARCLDERRYNTRVEADVAEARRFGLVGTPAFAVNGTPLSGAHEYRTFRRLIEVELPPKPPGHRS